MFFMWYVMLVSFCVVHVELFCVVRNVGTFCMVHVDKFCLISNVGTFHVVCNVDQFLSGIECWYISFDISVGTFCVLQNVDKFCLVANVGKICVLLMLISFVWYIMLVHFVVHNVVLSGT